MKRTLALGGAVVVALTLTACGGYKADSGIVIEHVFVPESTTYITQCTPVGKTTVCNPVPVHEDQCFKVRVEDDKGHRGSWCIKAQADWESIELGDYFEAAP